MDIPIDAERRHGDDSYHVDEGGGRAAAA